MATTHPVRESRIARGLTQEALAEKAGVSQVTISDIESGKTSSPSFAVALRLAKVLRVKPEFLFPVEAGR